MSKYEYTILNAMYFVYVIMYDKYLFSKFQKKKKKHLHCCVLIKL